MSMHTSSAPSGGVETATVPTAADWIGAVLQLVASLKYGVVQIVVHDGRVVQIDRTEKIRIETKH